MSATSQLLGSLVLKPMSWLYGAVTGVRNKMFDTGLLAQREFDIPLLVIGNLAVGGTGKTPHTEYFIEQLRNTYNIGVLSRGYNRRTKGFVLADDDSTAHLIGDEPLQIYRKFGHGPRPVMVAVCEDRCRGIDRMRELNPDLNLIILDDAFQHRYVKPGLSVVLTEYARPVYADSLLPHGRLREGLGSLHRADIVVVTKCPEDMRQLDYRLFAKNLELYPYQRLYFSKYEYCAPQPVFPLDKPLITSLDDLGTGNYIIALAGIAHPLSFVRHLRQSKAKVKGLIFSDHHNYTPDDIHTLVRKIKSTGNPAKTIVITTEKDAMRLRAIPDLPSGLKSRLYYIPIKVKIIPHNVHDNRVEDNDLIPLILQTFRLPQR